MTTSYLGYLDNPYLEDRYLASIGLNAFGMEANLIVADAPKSKGVEASRFIVDRSATIGVEADLNVVYYEPRGAEALRQISAPDARGAEAALTIQALSSVGAEAALTINDSDIRAMEVNLLRAISMGMQTRLVLYNTNRLRILCDFPSRGTSGINWASTSVAAGDFSVNNLNTDIVEQVTRTNPGDTSVVWTCDTQVVQGVSIDTVAMLNHNLSSSATITVEGSNSPTFSPINQSFAISVEELNSYYIAPTFPTVQSRYVRFIVSDPTNPDNYLQCGTIVFGTSIIFQGECFTDSVTRRRKHFSDKVATEGYTNVSNDRALKRAVSLEFRFLQFDRGNYRNINDVFEFARTSLKCLWIPDPKEPSRFGVFGKLPMIPDEVHRNMGEGAADNLDFNVEIDESL